MSPLELAAQFGFPALLVVILLRAQATRDRQRDRIHAERDLWYRSQLAELTHRQTAAIAQAANQIANLARVSAENTAAIQRLTECQLGIARELADSPCPLRHAWHPFEQLHHNSAAPILPPDSIPPTPVTPTDHAETPADRAPH